jgi:hypothetical protein
MKCSCILCDPLFEYILFVEIILVLDSNYANAKDVYSVELYGYLKNISPIVMHGHISYNNPRPNAAKYRRICRQTDASWAC